MRRTVFEDELAALWAEAGPRAVPRPRLAAHHHLALRGLVVGNPPVQSLCLRNATVQAGTGAVWTGRGNWLALSSAARPDLPPPSAAGKALGEAPGEASGEALWALWPGGARTADQPADRTSDRAPGWRARFLLEDLPQLLLAAHRAPPGTPVLIAADLPPEARQAIGALLPGHPLRVLAPGDSLRIPRLHAATIGSLAGLELTPHSLEAITRLRATVPPGGAERVLLWHGGLSRRLRNAPALRQMLEAQGFVTAETDRLSLTERIQALSMAREVIVPDPDCGIDSLFAPPGARILPLLPAEEGLEDALHLWTLLGDLAGMEVTAILGSAPYRRLRTRFLPGHRGRVFHVDPALILPFVPAAGPPPDLPLRQSLDALYGSSGAADVLTGAWAVHAGPTPAGFEDRLRHLRRQAALGISAAEAADLPGLMAHPFFADFARSIRSGFPVLAGLDAEEAALAAQLRASFAGEAAAGPLPAAALAGPEGARRRLLLAMLLLPGWSVPLPDAAALPEDVVERHLAWAVAPAALIRAGEDAAWVRHVEALLHWLADRLADADLPEGLRLRLRRMAGRLDLGQLLLIDQPLRGVQEARNRVLDLITPGEDSAVTETASVKPQGRIARLRERAGFYRERLRLAAAGHPRGLWAVLPALALRALRALRQRLRQWRKNQNSAVTETVSAGSSGSSVSSGRLRVGILCRTFEKGPDSEAVVAFLRGFDPARFEVFAYSIGFRDRVVSRDPAFDLLFDAVIPHRRDLPADPAGIRAQLLADRLDVFLYANATTYGLQPLDLALYRRVAPVQAVLNSHVPMPMGYPSFDAVLTGASDSAVDEVAQAGFAERLVRLPGPVINYLTTLEPRPDPPLDRAALGLGPQDVVLMNAGSSMKLRHECLRAMMQAAAGVENGVLLLAPYNPGWAARSMAFVFNRQLEEVAAEVGLDPARIRVLGELSVAEAEAALSCADVYLNPFPHGGATMTHLALIHGVPPVTLRRRSTRSIDQFLVESHGFADLLADTPEAYVALARSLGNDPARRATLKQRLHRAAADPGFVNNPDYAKNMQNAVQNLWNNAQR